MAYDTIYYTLHTKRKGKPFRVFFRSKKKSLIHSSYKPEKLAIVDSSEFTVLRRYLSVEAEEVGQATAEEYPQLRTHHVLLRDNTVVYRYEPELLRKILAFYALVIGSPIFGPTISGGVDVWMRMVGGVAPGLSLAEYEECYYQARCAQKFPSDIDVGYWSVDKNGKATKISDSNSYIELQDINTRNDTIR